MANINPAKFVREVRQEMNRVTWPTRRETMISTLMVLLMVTVAALFFITVDWIISMAVRFILGFGG